MNIKLPFFVSIEDDIEQWRVDTFWDKEPETLYWIRSFKQFINDKVFCDIGANIGLYSLYAASLYPDMLIIAIEPRLRIYIKLCKNIVMNLFTNIVPVYAGIGKHDCYLNIDYQDHLKYRKIPFYRFDRYASIFGCPDFLKMDIDGGEYDALDGMKKTLRNPYLKSALIEFDTNDEKLADETIKEICAGTDLSIDNEFNKLEDHSSVRRKRNKIKVKNVIFTTYESR